MRLTSATPSSGPVSKTSRFCRRSPAGGLPLWAAGNLDVSAVHSGEDERQLMYVVGRSDERHGSRSAVHDKASKSCDGGIVGKDV